jgi:hypothetical protein
MDATLILIDSDTELARARALVDELWNSNNPADVAPAGEAISFPRTRRTSAGVRH